MSVVKQLIPNQSNRRSTVQWYSPFSFPWLNYCATIRCKISVQLHCFLHNFIFRLWSSEYL